ncbi:unnamed protein product, partial [Allacma fusca]
MAGVPSFDNITYTMLPLFWVEATAELPEHYIQLMKEMFLNKEAILEIVKWLVIGLNVGLVILGFLMVGWKRARESEAGHRVETANI